MALEHLSEAATELDADARDLVRKVMVGVFTELGADHELSRRYRRKLAAVLY